MSLWQEARMCCAKAFTKREKILKNFHSAIKMENFTQHLLDLKIKFKNHFVQMILLLVLYQNKKTHK